MKSQSIGHFLFLLGISIWLGGLVFLGYGVAPVNFQTAEQWQVEGVNPNHAELEQGPRNVAGEITARSIQRLNHIEFAGIILCSLGVFFFWYPRFNRPNLLITQSVILVIMISLFMIYGIILSERLSDLRIEYAFDFSVNAGEISPQRAEFDQLHQWYTRLAGINIILAVVQIGIASAQYSGIRYGILNND